MYNVKNYPEKNCLGSRNWSLSNGPYQWISYKEASDKTTYFGSGLINLFDMKEKDCLGIFAKNREEWVIAERTIYAYNMLCVPLYDTLGEKSIGFIIF